MKIVNRIDTGLYFSIRANQAEIKKLNAELSGTTGNAWKLPGNLTLEARNLAPGWYDVKPNSARGAAKRLQAAIDLIETLFAEKKPEAPYVYEITAIDKDGKEIKPGRGDIRVAIPLDDAGVFPAAYINDADPVEAVKVTPVYAAGSSFMPSERDAMSFAVKACDAIGPNGDLIDFKLDHEMGTGWPAIDHGAGFKKGELCVFGGQRSGRSTFSESTKLMYLRELLMRRGLTREQAQVASFSRLYGTGRLDTPNPELQNIGPRGLSQEEYSAWQAENIPTEPIFFNGHPEQIIPLISDGNRWHDQTQLLEDLSLCAAPEVAPTTGLARVNKTQVSVNPLLASLIKRI